MKSKKNYILNHVSCLKRNGILSESFVNFLFIKTVERLDGPGWAETVKNPASQSESISDNLPHYFLLGLETVGEEFSNQRPELIQEEKTILL